MVLRKIHECTQTISFFAGCLKIQHVKYERMAAVSFVSLPALFNQHQLIA